MNNKFTKIQEKIQFILIFAVFFNQNNLVMTRLNNKPK
jgi:hypothetical protein